MASVLSGQHQNGFCAVAIVSAAGGGRPLMDAACGLLCEVSCVCLKRLTFAMVFHLVNVNRPTQSAPLQEAEMSLKNFEASRGNVRYLETAQDKAMTALVQGHTLDVKLSAAIIAVSAGYVHMSKVSEHLPKLGSSATRCIKHIDAVLSFFADGETVRREPQSNTLLLLVLCLARSLIAIEVRQLARPHFARFRC